MPSNLETVIPLVDLPTINSEDYTRRMQNVQYMFPQLNEVEYGLTMALVFGILRIHYVLPGYKTVPMPIAVETHEPNPK